MIVTVPCSSVRQISAPDSAIAPSVDATGCARVRECSKRASVDCGVLLRQTLLDRQRDDNATGGDVGDVGPESRHRTLAGEAGADTGGIVASSEPDVERVRRFACSPTGPGLGRIRSGAPTFRDVHRS